MCVCGNSTLIAFSLLFPARLLHIVLSTGEREGWGAENQAGEIRENAGENFEPFDSSEPSGLTREAHSSSAGESSPPLPRDQAKTSLETNASQTDAHLPLGHPPSPIALRSIITVQLWHGSTVEVMPKLEK